MLIPQTYAGALILIVLSMICWGSWANAFKLTGKWRFELFYYDYSLGVLLAAIIAAYTFGSMGDELSFSDNLIVAGKRNMAWAVAGGVVFNLANMLLVAAISVAGLAVAFPVGIGLALVVGVVWNYFLNPQGNPILLTVGVVLVVGAIIVDAFAYSSHAGGAKAPVVKGKSKAPPKAGGAGLKGIVLSLISGALMGSFYPLVEMGKGAGMDAAGLGPYAVAFMFALGVFFSTFIFNLYFLNLPVQGEPLSMFSYFQGTLKQHALGIAGGLLWCTGAIANFTASSAPKSVEVGPAVSYAIGQGATMVSALWGLLVWKEFAGASPKVRLMLGVMLVLFIGGLALISIAPRYVK
ncbi:MAG TPA: multidrug DMT transporter permease [Bryobacteraceae bacterium]